MLDIQKTIGRVNLEVERDFDDYPETSWLGVFSNFRLPETTQQKLVHLATKKVLDKSGLWRDSKGRITSAPTVNSYSNKYQFTFHDNGHDRLRYALQDSEYLEKITNNDEWFWVLSASVYLDGVEIGSASISGFPSTMSEKELSQEEHLIGLDALTYAKQWQQRNLLVKGE